MCSHDRIPLSTHSLFKLRPEKFLLDFPAQRSSSAADSPGCLLFSVLCPQRRSGGGGGGSRGLRSGPSGSLCLLRGSRSPALLLLLLLLLLALQVLLRPLVQVLRVLEGVPGLHRHGLLGLRR